MEWSIWNHYSFYFKNMLVKISMILKTLTMDHWRKNKRQSWKKKITEMKNENIFLFSCFNIFSLLHFSISNNFYLFSSKNLYFWNSVKKKCEKSFMQKLQLLQRSSGRNSLVTKWSYIFFIIGYNYFVIKYEWN